MLWKLMKYELRATYTFILPILGGLLCMAGLLRLTVEYMNWESIAALFGSVLVLVFMLSLYGSLLFLFVTAVIRFYRSMVGQEGYLTHTLPVNIHALLWSKLLTTVLWFAAYGVALLGCGALLLVGGKAIPILQGIFALGEDILNSLGGATLPMCIELAVYSLVMPFATVLCIYFCIAVGQTWKRKKLLGAFLTYFGLSAAMQVISTIVYTLLGVSHTLDSMIRNTAALDVVSYLLLPMLVLQLAVGVVAYLVTARLFTRGLNLE